MGKENVLDSANGSAQHASDEERGSKHSAGRSTHKGKRSSEDLERGETSEQLPAVLTVQCLAHELVASAHDLRKSEKGDESDEESGKGGLPVLCPCGQGFEGRTQQAK